MVVVYDVFIYFGTIVYVIRFNGEYFLQGVCCVVCFQRLYFYFFETLIIELCFIIQRLLSNQVVRIGGTRVYFVVDQVVQFQYVYVINGYRTFELFISAIIVQADLIGSRQVVKFQQFFNFCFFRIVEYRRCDWYIFAQVFSQTYNFFIVEGIQVNFLTNVSVQIVRTLDEFAQFRDFLLLFQYGVDFVVDIFRSYIQVGFEDLIDVYTRRYVQRVQYDVYRRIVFIVRYIFDRVDFRNYIFVIVTICYFVIRLDTAFNRQIYFNNFQYVRCQIVVLGDFAAFRFEFFFEFVFQFVILFSQLFQLILFFFVCQVQFQLAIARQFVEFFSFNVIGYQYSTDTVEQIRFEDLQFFRQVFFRLFELYFFDFQRTFVFFYVIASKDLNVDNRIGYIVWYAQRRVFNVRGFFIEDRTQQFFFWGQLSFIFRRYFINQNVVIGYFRINVNDIGFIQFGERSFIYVRDVSGDFFRIQFGVTGYIRQFLNVDGGETVFLNNTFGYEDGVFEVVIILRYERYAYVLIKRQFIEVGGRIVCQYVVTFNRFIQRYIRYLVDIGVLVRTGVFGQVVDVDICFIRIYFVFVNFDNDTGSIYVLNDIITFSYRSYIGVNGNSTFYISINQRFISAQSRNGLTLYVRIY